MIRTFQNLVRSTDSAVARLYLSLFRERNALNCFLFHSLFRHQADIARDLIDPLDRTTVAHLRQLIEYYLAHGYRFVGPREVLGGLSADRKYAMITFDDGYFNNTLALPVLESLGVPAVFFISSGHVRDGKCFWWDVLYRERRAQGASPRQVYREALGMKYLKTEEIERRLTDRFGPGALRPRTDIDRPFTPDELREFARHPLVQIGNHTAGHAILTNYSGEGVRWQIGRCQDDLQEMTGQRPEAIAYPNGAYNADVLAACDELGIRLGFTIKPHKSPIPVGAGPPAAGDGAANRAAVPGSKHGLLKLGRFVPHAAAPMVAQCRSYRSDVPLYGMLRAGYLQVRRGRISN
ncbi:MAG TPA: polysaccharide deacetylase family protein [Tepidisphaeraceae bacterium]|nr:polysaccharide deacetylase family protein [Tepidisphaeraceae bacterium]